MISKLHKERNRLREDKNYYQSEIKQANEVRSKLFGNVKNLEKFGREKYLMKRSDEDIFLIVEDQKE